jgi:hypothetical protein
MSSKSQKKRIQTQQKRQKKSKTNSFPFSLYEKDTGIVYDDNELWKELNEYLNDRTRLDELNRLLELKRFVYYTEVFNGKAEDFYKQHIREINRDVSKQAIFKKAFSINNLSKFKRELKDEYPDDFYNPELRNRILEEQDSECALCGGDISNIEPHLHHIDYDKQNCDKDNLVFLCPRCHGKTNSQRDFWKELLREYKEEK